MYELGELEAIIAPDGEVFVLGDGAARAVLALGGRGAPAVEYQTVRGYRQASETVVEWTLQPRSISALISWASTTRDEYWRARAELTRIMRPNQGGPLRLRHVRADGTQRDIEAYPDSTPVFEDDYAWETFEERLAFICYDPVFYDPFEQTIVFASSPMADLAFPVEFPIQFGDSLRLGDEVAVAYPGDWPAYPRIDVTGPYTTLAIVNLTTGARVKLGQPVVAGETRTIDLAPGKQRIVDGAGANRFHELVLPDSDLVAFNLRPAGLPLGDSPHEGVPGGVNVLRVEAAGQVAGQTQVTVTYQPRYLSVA